MPLGGGEIIPNNEFRITIGGDGTAYGACLNNKISDAIKQEFPNMVGISFPTTSLGSIKQGKVACVDSRFDLSSLRILALFDSDDGNYHFPSILVLEYNKEEISKISQASIDGSGLRIEFCIDGTSTVMYLLGHLDRGGIDVGGGLMQSIAPLMILRTPEVFIGESYKFTITKLWYPGDEYRDEDLGVAS